MFFLNGELIGSSSTEKKGELKRDDEFHQTLIKKSTETTAMLTVKKVSLMHIVQDYSFNPKVSEPVSQSIEVDNIAIDEKPEEEVLKIIEMLQQLMFIYEKFISGTKRISDDFDTILKRKFMQKLDKFDFLDPFAAEFKYLNGKIKYSGVEEEGVVAEGLVECLQEISEENKMQQWLAKHLLPWKEKYSNEISRLNIKM